MAVSGLLRPANRLGGPVGPAPFLMLALLAVIAGIVGMHVLSIGHHAPTAAYSVTGDETLIPDQGAHGSQVGHRLDASAASQWGPEVAALECGPGCSDGLVRTGASCLVALTLLLFLGRPRQQAQRHHRPTLKPRLSRLIALRAHRSAPRPPSLAALCILRI